LVVHGVGYRAKMRGVSLREKPRIVEVGLGKVVVGGDREGRTNNQVHD